MVSTTLAFFIMLGLSGTLIAIVDGSTFLEAKSTAKQDRISEADIQTSLLSEVEATFGEGSASSRVKQLEKVLRPMYAALPKNPQGNLGHATVRYSLHRLFVQRHGWVIKGLDAAGGPRNSTSGAGLLKEQVPAYIQDLFEKRLGGHGFGLHEMAILAATIEQLVHREAIKRMGDVLKIHNRLATAVMSEQEADDILDTYMMSYILGEEMSANTHDDALKLAAEMPLMYPTWEATREFVHAVRRNVTEADAGPAKKSSGELDFSLVARTAERVGEQFGSFQNEECKQMKASLVKNEDHGTGRVPLAEFYKTALEGRWPFQDSAAYLRQTGALDETEPENPRVIIANFLTSPSNCMASSSFYSVCCMDECEDLLSHLEQELASPEATTTQIIRIVSSLSSTSVVGPRKLSFALLGRLGEVAAEHGGKVPLHGRLFAQWMHHAFPRECPYPHVAGTINSQTPDEWLQDNGDIGLATKEEMLGHIERAESKLAVQDASIENSEFEEPSLPWAPEEELLIASPPSMQANMDGFLLTKLHNGVLFMAMGLAAYGLVHSSLGAPTAKSCGGVDKFMI